jgi:cathepsin A (carboxypeptidase C)/serine carboxypeptidase-like clade 2
VLEDGERLSARRRRQEEPVLLVYHIANPQYPDQGNSHFESRCRYHEAVSEPEKKPWILWLNGGPGCSSLGGMFVELGPFVVDSGLNVTLNPYAWNKLANVLFLEQPAGVGFSYPSATTDDATTSADTYEALVGFLRAHSELQDDRKFYILGESYGGHYVPNTALRVQEGNKKLEPKSADRINLVGFAVGNGYTDWQLDFNANVPNGRYHALTSQARLDEAEQKCGGDYAPCFWPRPDKKCEKECDEAVSAATNDAMDGSIDIYDIYEDVCLDSAARLPTQQFVLLQERRSAIAKARSAHGRQLQTTISPVFPTCVDDFSARYLNLKEVQAAIHVNASSVPGGKWADCGGVDYAFNYESELPNYQRWVHEGELEILIYNGDADYILSHMGNAAWIREGLGLRHKETEWTKWRGSDKQVAGYFEQFSTGGKHLGAAKLHHSPGM